MERRDQIYPPESQEGYPAEVQALVGNVETTWDRFFTFVDSETSYTGYVMLSD